MMLDVLDMVELGRKMLDWLLDLKRNGVKMVNNRGCRMLGTFFG